MAVRVRLTRVGSKKNAMWRVVVADQRSPRDGRFIEMIGHYNPQTEPSQIVIDRERLDHWLRQGAQPSETVRKLMRAKNSEPPVAKAAAAPEAAPAPAGGQAGAGAPDAPAGEPVTAREAEAPPAADATEAGTPDAAAGSESERSDAALSTDAVAQADSTSDGDEASAAQEESG